MDLTVPTNPSAVYNLEVKTDEGHAIKVLSDVLQNIVKNVCIKFSKEGICIRQMNSNGSMLVDVFLDRDAFNVFNVPEPIQIDIVPASLFKMIKSIKKKDALTLRMCPDEPSTLQIVVHPIENNRISTSCINIQHMKVVNIVIPNEYNTSINIPSGEFQRAIKDMRNINNELLITIRRHSLQITCGVDRVCARRVQFGELNDNSDVEFTGTYSTEQFMRIIKFSGLGNKVRVHTHEKFPLRISTPVGMLGTMSVLIKSKEQIASESALQ